MVKSLDCLHYQCCEGPVRDTPLYGRLTALSIDFDGGGVRETLAYARAPWRLEEDDLGPESETVAGFRSELTPAGEQFVVPGCERNRSAALRQLDLFG